MIEPELPAATEEILATIAREVPEYARPLEGAFGAGIRTGVTRGAAPVRRADPRPGRRPRAGPRRLRRARPRRAAPGPDARLAAVRLPRRRAGRLAADLRRRPARAASIPTQLAAPRRGDLRLHRRALRRLGRGLRAGAARAGGRAPAPPPGAARAAASRSARRGLRAARGGAGRGLAAAHEAPRRSPWRRATCPRVARRLSADALAASVDGIGCALVPGAAEREPSAELERATESVSGGARTDRAARRAGLVVGPRQDAPCARRRPGRSATAGPIVAEEHLPSCCSSSPAASPSGWRAAQACSARRAHPGGPHADGGDGPRLRPARRQRRGDGAGAPPAPADDPLPARPPAGALRRSLDDPDARFELELALRSRSASRLLGQLEADHGPAVRRRSRRGRCRRAPRRPAARSPGPAPSPACRARRRRARSGRRPCRGRPCGKPGPWSRTVTVPSGDRDLDRSPPGGLHLAGVVEHVRDRPAEPLRRRRGPARARGAARSCISRARRSARSIASRVSSSSATSWRAIASCPGARASSTTSPTSSVISSSSSVTSATRRLRSLGIQVLAPARASRCWCAGWRAGCAARARRPRPAAAAPPRSARARPSSR